MTTKLVFLGGGNMAEAIFAGLISNPEFKIEVIQRNLDKITALKQKYPGITVTATLDHVLNPEDIIVLAIKPQQAKEALLPIKDKLANCLVVSVMAGLNCATISNWLANPRIIRTMPSTPSSIKEGITAVFATSAVSPEHYQLIQDIFATIGIVYPARTEDEIDKIVPISSSAVAFQYYFMEGLINNAVSKFGFSEADATKLVLQLVKGSYGLLEANPSIAITEQRARVTSKKGATEQGVLTFEKQQLHQIIGEAMSNCYNRAVEMAEEFK